MTEARAAVTHFAGRLGQLELLYDSAINWASYKKWVTSFLMVNPVTDSNKVHADFSIVDPKTYGLLKSFTARELPFTKNFEVVEKGVRDQLSQKVFVIRERARFHRSCQKNASPYLVMSPSFANCRKPTVLEARFTSILGNTSCAACCEKTFSECFSRKIAS
ncbi:hypothetical protein HPB50_016055 [Hyalomma asiaticum]|uniref:Uncharacterized protein n=1 Tax=Hyalomma asiaticum TaxID=266040 RepID=A0ACB7RXX8_HYAAI|nr:hypothetical protein HPB50_016055 [Hyalomma asiaticum]